MADVISGVTETSSTAEERISTVVQEVLTQEMVVAPLFMDFSNLATPGVDSISIPRFGNFTVNSKSENTAVSAQANAFSVDTLALSSHKVVQWLLEDIANIQAKISVNANYIEQAARDLAADLDDVAITTLDAGISTSAPDHVIPYSDATNEDLADTDILEAKRLLDVAKVPLGSRWGIIGPSQEKNVLLIDKHVLVNQSGTDAALRNGQIGRVYGFDIIMTASAQIEGDGTVGDPTYWGHPSAMAFARQLAPRVKTDDDLPNLAERHSIDHIFGFKVLDSGKRAVKLQETP